VWYLRRKKNQIKGKEKERVIKSFSSQQVMNFGKVCGKRFLLLRENPFMYQ